MKAKIIIKCRYCGIEQIITPPKRKLKQTIRIDIKCLCCQEINSFSYVYKIDRKTEV